MAKKNLVMHMAIITSAAAIAVGLGLNVQHAMEEEDNNSKVLTELDINNIDAVINVFKNGTEEDKVAVAQKIGRNITWYSINTIVSLLNNIDKRPHRILVNAIAKNITHYAPESIIRILEGDSHKETHDIIASSLKRNYSHFTQCSFLGYQYAVKEFGYNQYLKIVRVLDNAYLHIALEPLLNSLEQYVDTQFTDHTKTPSVESPICIGAHFATKIGERIYVYTDKQLSLLLKLADESAQKVIASSIAQNVTRFNFSSLCNIITKVNDENKAVIVTAISQHDDLIKTANGHELYTILAAVDEKVQSQVLGVLLSNNIFKNGGYVIDTLRTHLKKVNENARAQISQEWGLTEEDWSYIELYCMMSLFHTEQTRDSNKQFTYTIAVNDEIKEMITSICNARGITEKITIGAINAPDALAAVSYNSKKHTYELYLNLPALKETNEQLQRFVLEHELGGHLLHDHTLFASSIIRYLQMKHNTTSDNILNSASFQALKKAHEYEADLSSAIEDLTLAHCAKQALENTESKRLHKLYMSRAHLIQAINAIIKLKEAEQKWFDGEEAYNLYGPPAYDRMVFEESKTSVEQDEKD